MPEHTPEQPVPARKQQGFFRRHWQEIGLAAAIGLPGFAGLAGMMGYNMRERAASEKGSELSSELHEITMARIDAERKQRDKAHEEWLANFEKESAENTREFKQEHQKFKEEMARHEAWLAAFKKRTDEQAQQIQKHVEEQRQRPYTQIRDAYRTILSTKGHIVHADHDHTAEEIPLMVAAYVDTLSEMGVDAIFLELPQEYNHKESVQKYGIGRTSYQVIPTDDYLRKYAEEHGIKVFYMDKDVTSEAAKRGEQAYFKHMRLSKTVGHDTPETLEALKALDGPDWEEFLKERRAVNQAWADFVEEMTQKYCLRKSVSFGGSYHVINPIKDLPDFDEMIAAKPALGGCQLVHLYPNSIAKDPLVLLPDEEGMPVNFFLPTLPKQFKEKLSYEEFRALAKDHQWSFVAMHSKADQLRHVDPKNHAHMMAAGDEANVDLYYLFESEDIEQLRAQGTLAHIAALPEKEQEGFADMLREFRSKKKYLESTMSLPQERKQYAPFFEHLNKANDATYAGDMRAVITHLSALDEYIHDTVRFWLLNGPSSQLLLNAQVELAKRKGFPEAAHLLEKLEAYNNWNGISVGREEDAVNLQIHEADMRRYRLFQRARAALCQNDLKLARSYLDELNTQAAKMRELVQLIDEARRDIPEEARGFIEIPLGIQSVLSRKDAEEDLCKQRAAFDALLEEHIQKHAHQQGIAP